MAAQQAATGTAETSRKALLLGAGLALGAVLPYVLYEFFDPVNLFALRLTEATVGTTNATALSVGVALAFVSGATMVFTPCGMPLIFALNSMAREGNERGRSWLFPGIAGVMALWGGIVGFAGGGIVDFLADPSRRFTVTEILYTALGVFALLMALWEFGWVGFLAWGGHRAIPASVARLGRYPRSLAMGAALGGGFGVGCPFPTYQAVLAWAAVVGNPLYGAVVLAANALGRAAPLYVIGGLAYRGTRPEGDITLAHRQLRARQAHQRDGPGRVRGSDDRVVGGVRSVPAQARGLGDGQGPGPVHAGLRRLRPDQSPHHAGARIIPRSRLGGDRPHRMPRARLSLRNHVGPRRRYRWKARVHWSAQRTGTQRQASKRDGERGVKEMTTAILKVDGMHCNGCERNAEFALSSLPGVARVKADREAKTVEIAFEPLAIDEARIRRAVEEMVTRWSRDQVSSRRRKR